MSAANIAVGRCVLDTRARQKLRSDLNNGLSDHHLANRFFDKNVILSHFSAEKMLYNNIYSYIMMLSVVQEVNDQSYSRFT